MSGLPPPALSRSPLFILSIAVAFGLLCARLPLPRPGVVIIFGATLTAASLSALVLMVRRKLFAASVCVVTAFALTGLSLGIVDANTRGRGRLAQLYKQGTIKSGEPVELTATIEGPPETAPEQIFFRVQAHHLRFKQTEYDCSGTVMLAALLTDEERRRAFNALELHHGARIRVMVALDREDTFRNPGAMQVSEYLERNDFEATGVIKSPLLVARLDDDAVFLPLGWLYDWRQTLQQQFTRIFKPETAGVLNAALLGNRYGLSQSAADRFRAGGTFHVLVISGMQISFIGALVFLGAGWFTRRRIWRFLIATFLICAYTIAVGGDAPVARAALMFTLIILAPVIWRRANSLNVIGATALLLFVWRPQNLSDPSFQLTFLSVLAIVLIAVPLVQTMQRIGSWVPTMVTPYPPQCSDWLRRLSEALFWSEAKWRAELTASNISYRLFKNPMAAKLERWHLQRFCRFVFAAAIVSTVVQVAMLPPMIVYFHRLSFASLVLNILVGALMAVLGVTAVLAVIASQVSAGLAAPFILLVEKLNWLMIHSVDPFARLGVASIRLPHYSGWMAVIYGLYYGALTILVVGISRWHPLQSPISKARRSRSRRIVAIAAVAAAALSTLIVAHPFSSARPDGKLHIDFLDVGQGDSALVTMPDGTTLLIDGGGRPNIDWTPDAEADSDPFQRDTRTIGERVVSEFLWSEGLDHVDYILATHADADHIDGLNDIVRNFKVQAAFVARTPAFDPGFARFARSLSANGVSMELIGRGDSIEMGGVLVDVLWPPQSADANGVYRNNDAVVLRVRYGDRRLLFAADIEKEAEKALLDSHTNLHAEIIKVAHHGSRTSSIQSFVDAIAPQVAVISVGRTSIFGHPHKEVVERWRASGAQVMTTGDKGTIRVVTDGRNLAVTTFVR
jgi:competence protein ComEC